MDLSANGRYAAYWSLEARPGAAPEHDLMIDDRAVLTGVSLDFKWFDDDRIAVLLREEADDGVVDSIVIVNAATGGTVSGSEVTRY